MVQTLIRHVFGGIASGSTLLAIMTTCGTDTKLEWNEMSEFSNTKMPE